MIDDVVLIPAGVWLFELLVPAAQMAEHRAAAESASHRPSSWVGLLIVLLVWLLVAAFVWSLIRWVYD